MSRFFSPLGASAATTGAGATTGGGFDWRRFLSGIQPGESGGVPSQGVGSIPSVGMGGQWGNLITTITKLKAMEDARKAQEKSNKANEARYQEILGLSRGFRDQTDRRFNILGDLVKRRGDDVLAGYDTARKELEGVGETSRRRIRDAGTQREAIDVQSLASRGLGNTTVVDARRRSTREEVDRNMADIDERVAALRSGLAERRAQAVQSTGRDLEDFIRFRTSFQGGLLGEEMNFMERRTDMFNNDQVLQMLAAGGGGGFGMTGFGGAGGGGMSRNQGILAGAGQGAIAGSAFGPWGAVIGGVAGGVLGSGIF